MKAAILFQKVDEKSAVDDLDVLTQKYEISKALGFLGTQTIELPVDLNLEKIKSELLDYKPDFVFNLVESIDGCGQLLYFVPALLERLAIPYSGCSADALFITTNKILTKERMISAAIKTPPWCRQRPVPFFPPYIVKPISEDASVDIDEEMVVFTASDLDSIFKACPKDKSYFVEQYIDGREFNLSVLASPDGPQVLPPAEICFIDYPPEKTKVVGYKAKWQSASFEYLHTVRRLDFPTEDTHLLNQLEKIALECWSTFSLTGYARIDFRVDNNGVPWVLEVNANPCISPDSGFIAAAEKVGLSYQQVVERIIKDVVPLSN